VGQSTVQSQALTPQGEVRRMTIQVSEHGVTHFSNSEGNRHAEILAHLAQIQDSPAFCNSARSKEFLSYVVEQVLAGHLDNLKERSIGVNLFHRPPTYDTGEDPIVRVKAGEVRRRLGEYYAGVDKAPELHIDLPVGSYVPKFRWRSQTDSLPLAPEPQVLELPPVIVSKQSSRRRVWQIAAAVITIGIATLFLVRTYDRRTSALDLFWEPLTATKEPVLICVPSPVGYALNSDLFPKSPAASSGIYDSVAKRNTTPLQLAPETSIQWNELTPLTDFFVNKDDAYVADELSTFFAQTHRPSQVRFGRDYTYEDLRNSPAILIGAYNNPWMDRVMSDLPIGFRESGELLWIEDRTKPGQVWKASLEGRLGTKDFALVARVLNAKTGQFLIIISGIGMVGTKAAGRTISHEGDLKAALRSVTAGWERKNLEVVLETDVVDRAPSPPHAVAVKVW
jgi:hypothetical protein